MKKKLFALLLIAVMVLSSFSAVFADETGTITITNAANGETYSIVKLFDAINGNGTVNYKGDIPTELSDFFVKQEGTVDGVVLKDNVDETALAEALQAWAETKDADAEIVASGGPVVFSNIPFGYYVVLTTQGAGKASITSANPTATIFDKNTSEPTLTKTINDHDVSIGDTVTYTVTANAPNYLDGTKKVVSYQFEDTLPAFISDVNITSITVSDAAGDHEITDGLGAWTSNSRKAIAWVDGSGNHIYKNDAVITIVYTAKITAAATEGSGAANQFGANINIVTMIPKVEGPNGEPEDYEKKWKDEDYTKTYAVALIKTNDDETPERLAGAKFQVKGLVVTGADGEYTVVSYNKDAEDYTGATEMVTGADGTIIIHGLASDVTLTAQETEAPAGYNKLDGDFTLTPQIVSKEVVRTETIQYFETTEKGTCKTDADWQKYLKETVTSTETEKTEYNTDLVAASASNTVVNKTGSTLPETGGIGTTIIYILGAALVIGAGVMLVTRKKMNDR